MFPLNPNKMHYTALNLTKKVTIVQNVLFFYIFNLFLYSKHTPVISLDAIVMIVQL